jgi:predicted TIM-barrel fold metal-dependent hydrolase
MKKTFSEYMRSDQVYYSFEPDEHTLNFVMDYVGEDRLVFASDYNHGDSKFPNTVRSVTERKNLTESQLRKLMHDNAARLYNIQAAGNRQQ